MNRLLHRFHLPLRLALMVAVFLTALFTLVGSALIAYRASISSVQMVWAQLAEEISLRVIERTLRTLAATPETGAIVRELKPLSSSEYHSLLKQLSAPVLQLQTYLDALQVGKRGMAAVFADDGRCIASSRRQIPLYLQTIEEGGEGLLLKGIWQRYVQTKKQSGLFDEPDCLVYLRRFPEELGIPWTAATLIHPMDFIEPIQIRTIYSLIFGFLICTGFVTAVAIFLGRISQKLKQISLLIDRIVQFSQIPSNQTFDRSFICEINAMNDSLCKMRTGLSSISKYLPVELLKNLIGSGKLAEPGGEKRVVTVLFSDLVDFTQLAEKLPPDCLAALLDAHFTSMSRQIHQERGIVDKFIGDAIMALWNAPQKMEGHELAACRAALAMMGCSAGDANPKQRIGVNTGMAVVGNFGSKDRIDYTAIGDPVNLASRLEGLNKLYGTSILIGEETASAVKEKLIIRPLDFVSVKGRSAPILVYELLGDPIVNPGLCDRAIAAYAAGLHAYRIREFDRAGELFRLAQECFGGEDGPSAVMLERCRSFLLNPPPLDWNGAFNTSI